MTNDQLYKKIMTSISVYVKNALLESQSSDFGQMIELKLKQSLKGELFDSWDGERWLDICDDVWDLEDKEFYNKIYFNEDSVSIADMYGDEQEFKLETLTKAAIVNNRLVMWWRKSEQYIVSNKMPSDVAKSIRKLVENNFLTEGECCMTPGAVYNTPMNTIGVGNPVPAGFNSLGSGDKFDTIGLGMATKSVAPKRSKKRKK